MRLFFTVLSGIVNNFITPILYLHWWIDETSKGLPQTPFPDTEGVLKSKLGCLDSGNRDAYKTVDSNKRENSLFLSLSVVLG